MQITESKRKIALTCCAVRQVRVPSARGFRGFSAQASSAMSEISLMTKPNADDAAMKTRRISRELSRGKSVSSAPNIPARRKRMPYASNRISLFNG